MVIFANGFPMRMPRRTHNGWMQHLHHFGSRRQPSCQLPRSRIMRFVSQRHARQRTQHGLNVVNAHVVAHAHVAQLDEFEQDRIASDDAAHQHIATATGVFC